MTDPMPTITEILDPSGRLAAAVAGEQITVWRMRSRDPDEVDDRTGTLVSEDAYFWHILSPYFAEPIAFSKALWIRTKP